MFRRTAILAITMVLGAAPLGVAGPSGILRPDPNIRSAAFSPDGNEVVLGCEDGTARIWDLKRCKEIASFAGHSGSVNAAVLSPDGRRLVTTADDRTVAIWDVATGKEIQSFPAQSGIQAPVFTRGGRFILYGDRLTVLLRSVELSTEPTRFVGHTGGMCFATLAPDGKEVLTGSGDQTARVWEIATGRELVRLEANDGWVDAGVFLPHGHVATSHRYHGLVRIWDLKTRSVCRELHGHQSAVSTLSVSPDGRRLLSASEDGTARMWDWRTGREIFHIEEEDPVVKNGELYTWGPLQAQFSPGGHRFLTASPGNVWIRDARDGKTLQELPSMQPLPSYPVPFVHRLWWPE